MFSRFLGKGGSGASKRVDAVDSRGLEVVEDDPETSWSMWDNALAEQDSRYSGMAPLSSSAPLPSLPQAMPRSRSETKSAEAFPDFDEVATEPMGLEERSPEQRAVTALEVVELYHHRIANTIRTLWGYKECSVYINRLIMNGGDGMGNARVGFNPDAAQAMLLLADLHDQIFGPADPGSTLGFSDSYHSTFDGHR
ncbi:hypothetical protein [Rhodoferax bucti]|uniref:hypothetical protein n=1 Tax=Rhodoferax bucti TaxID=2576305 RepID=UPI0011089F1E|nr:hypothetical protein [Rhodoferax bucti]